MGLLYLTPCVPLSWRGVPQERGKIYKEGLAPLFIRSSPFGGIGKGANYRKLAGGEGVAKLAVNGTVIQGG